MNTREHNAQLIASFLMVMALVFYWWSFDFINRKMWESVTWGLLLKYGLLSLLVLGATAWASKLLHESKVMQFSFLRFVKSLRWAANMVLTPIRLYRPLAVIYILFLTYSLPAIAFVEEVVFRDRITGIVSAIVVTIIFGLVHMLMGATLGVGIALMIPGGFFALVYMSEGILAATYLHIFYDVGAIALAVYLFSKESRQVDTLKTQPNET